MMRPILTIGNKDTLFSVRCSGESGFTLLEVLIAMTILAFGFSYIFPIFFGSISTVMHIDNRLRADMAVQNEIWDIKSYIATNVVTNEEKVTEIKNTDPPIRLSARIRKMNSFERLYRVDVTASWQEKNRDISINRTQYVRDG